MVSDATGHRVPATRWAEPSPATGPAGSATSADEEPTPTMTIEIAVDVRPAADGTWSVVLTPAIPALRTKRRDRLPTPAAAQAQARRMLEALAYGGFPVATTWTLDGDPDAWLAQDHHRLATPASARPHTARPGGSGSESRR